MREVVKLLSGFALLIYAILEAIVLKFIPRSLRYKNVEGETVLITGGGSGIGRLLAIRFSALGCRVIVWDVNEKGNVETVEMIKKNGGECYSYTCDVTNRGDVYSTAQKIKDEIGIVTVLINNAGIVVGKKCLEIPDHMIEKTLHVNALSHFWTCKAFLPDMISSNHGHIITVSSLAGYCGMNGLSDYCASKFATIGFHESITRELKNDNYTGIKTTLVCPFFVNTGLFNGTDPGYFSLLDPDTVADSIVASMRCNEELLIIPAYFSILIAVNSILPTSASNIVYEMLKGYSAMKNFVGRDEKND